MKSVLILLWLSALACCGQTNTPVAKAEELSVGGHWELHIGRSVNALDLTESKGVVSGVFTQDKDWGGHTAVVKGIMVGNEVQLMFSVLLVPNSPPTEYTLKGSLLKDRMGGHCQINDQTDMALWVANKVKVATLEPVGLSGEWELRQGGKVEMLRLEERPDGSLKGALYLTHVGGEDGQPVSGRHVGNQLEFSYAKMGTIPGRTDQYTIVYKGTVQGELIRGIRTSKCVLFYNGLPYHEIDSTTNSWSAVPLKRP